MFSIGKGDLHACSEWVSLLGWFQTKLVEKLFKDLTFLQLIVEMGEWGLGEVLCPCSPFPAQGKGPLLHVKGTRLPHAHCSHSFVLQTADAKERGAEVRQQLFLAHPISMSLSWSLSSPSSHPIDLFFSLAITIIKPIESNAEEEMKTLWHLSQHTALDLVPRAEIAGRFWVLPCSMML